MYVSDNFIHSQVFNLIDLDFEEQLIEILDDADIVVDLDNRGNPDENGN